MTQELSRFRRAAASTTTDLPVIDPNFRSLLGVVGTKGFYPQLASVLRDIGRCEHLHIFAMERTRPVVLAAVSADGSRAAEEHFDVYMRDRLWMGDDGMAVADGVDRTSAKLVRTAAESMSTAGLRSFFDCYGFAERLLFCNGNSSGPIAFAANKTGRNRYFSTEEVAGLTSTSGTILMLIGKHASLRGEDQRRSSVLTSLSVIETALRRADVRFTPRELEVCSRFIRGQSVGGVAIDLGISEGTVACYRKRIYRFLSIASYRELLLWYINLRSIN